MGESLVVEVFVQMENELFVCLILILKFDGLIFVAKQQNLNLHDSNVLSLEPAKFVHPRPTVSRVRVGKPSGATSSFIFMSR